MNIKLLCKLSACQLAFCCSLYAENTASVESETAPVHLVISANKIEQDQVEVSSSVIVLDKETIKNSQRQTVGDLLRTVSALDVVTSGGSGGNTSIFIRGANAEHTLVLLNGIELNNPSSTARLYNFANLSLADVERIEILVGPQGSLYGSDAVGGVISIFTKEQAEGSSILLSSELGSQKTYNNNLIAGTAGNWGAFNLTAERRETDGFSVQDNPVDPAEKDAYQSQTFSSNLKLKLTKEHELKIYGRFTDSSADIDDGFGEIPDDPNRVVDSTETLVRTQLQSTFNDLGGYQQTLGSSYSRHSLSDQDFPDQYRPNEFIDSSYKGRLVKFDYLGSLQVLNNQTLVFGLETENESADSSSVFIDDFGTFEDEFHPDSVRTNSAYLQLNSKWAENFSSSQGLRFDSHEQAGDELTYRVAPRYALTSDSSLRASWATGFKAPSLYQLYSIYGNSDLTAEESRGWEVAYNQQVLDKKIDLDFSYFENKIKNLIDFDSQTFLFSNTNNAKISGYSITSQAKLLSNLTARVAYTYLDTEDLDSQNSLLRRARHKISSGIDYQVNEDFSVGAEALLTGNRYDNDFSTFPAERTQLGSYTIFNLFTRYKINESLSFKARVENLLDKDYQEVLGFNTPGRLIFGGLELRL